MTNISLKVFAAFFAAVCLFGAFAPNSAAYAEAPMTQSPGPGFYRIKVGAFEVTALSDGINMRPVAQLLQLLQGDRAEVEAVLNRSYPEGQIPSSTNAFLVNTGAKLVLVDAGNGSMGSPAMGNVVNNLRAAGCQPERIDEIFLTHMHGDHVGGLVAKAERVFPNATVYANKTEAEYWLSDGNMNAAPDAAKRTFLAAKAALTPYINAGKFKTFEGNTGLIPGIRTEEAFGHTPGHTMYVIESKGETLVLWGDIMHAAAVQFENPSVAISYDSDPVEAVKSRQQILADAAKNGWLIGGVHLLFPGFGNVRANDGKGYIFLPLQ